MRLNVPGAFKLADEFGATLLYFRAMR